MTSTEIVTLDSIIVRQDGFVSSDIDGETALMSIEESTFYGLDTILSNIWKYIETPITASVLIDKLMEEYDVGKKECEQDVLCVLNDMVKDNLISVR